MRFEEVLPALREGKKVRRADWPSALFVDGWVQLSHSSILADDWEIVEETLTREQAKEAMRQGKWVQYGSMAPCAMMYGGIVIRHNAPGNYLYADPTVLDGPWRKDGWRIVPSPL